MSSYAEIADVEAGFRDLSEDEEARCTQLLAEAAIMIDAIAKDAAEDVKKLVSCRMVRRAIGSAEGDITYPVGATQGSASAMGYTQSWTITGGSSGAQYLTKFEKQILGVGSKLGSYSPIEELTSDD